MNESSKRPLALIILDGWGISTERDGNAIALAHTPFYDEIRATHPWTQLEASGQSLGLPAGAAGNPEVGHLNMGAGRIVKPIVSRISEAIADGEFFDNAALGSAFGLASATGSKVHLIGLLSDGDVHSTPETLYALLRMAKRHGVRDVFVHCILDGRDVPPRTADIYIEALEIKIADIGIGRIATLCGRFFAMDSGGNWERTARAYTMLVHAEGERAIDAVSAIRSSFLRGISDEFIAPIVIEGAPDQPLATIRNGDTVIFFNHRADTMRQLARSLAVPDHGSIAAAAKPRVESVCLTEYDSSFDMPVAFRAETAGYTLTQVLAERQILNCRISETDRFAHVTHFFNGGSTSGGQFEQHFLIPADDAASRDAGPEMKSFKVTDRLLRAVEADGGGIFVINFSASDIAAESGDLEKTVEAVQYVDTCLGGVLKKFRETDGVAIITSSHGHCESMTSVRDGERNRFPNVNPVPFHIIDGQANGFRLRDGGTLQDVAPTMLAILGIEKPPEMTGNDLRIF